MTAIRYSSLLLLSLVLVCETQAEDTKLLTELSKDKAQQLITEYHSKKLSLDGLQALTPEIARVLARHQGARERDRGWAQLSLNGVTALSPECAEALSKYTGILHLQSLTVLNSRPLAKKLAAQQGELYLDGLLTLPSEFAEILATNTGTRDIQLRADVIIHRGDRAASVLRFTNLSALTTEAASALSKHRGILVLNGLTTLSPDVANALAQHKGTLVLNGLLTLSPKTADILASSQNEIVLKALTTLSFEGAEALSKHKYKLYLDGPTKLSPKALEAIRKHPNVRLAKHFRP